MLDPSDVARGPIADALLFNAARSQHVAEVIRPALERGDIVVCDRYATSTLAYQGYGSGVDRDALRSHPGLGHGRPRAGPRGPPRRPGRGRASLVGDAGRADELTRFEDGARHDLAFHAAGPRGLPGDGGRRSRSLGHRRRQRAPVDEVAVEAVAPWTPRCGVAAAVSR